MRIKSNLQGIYKDSNFLYKKIESGIPFYQIANEFNRTKTQIKDIFYSREYKLWLQKK